MFHLAIMNRRFGFIPAILAGTKTIESRWYSSRRAPWGRVAPRDTIYFKNSGGLVTACAKVSRVEQYELKQGDVARVLKKYGSTIGFSKEQIRNFSKEYRFKKYCILITLTEVVCVKSFRFDKSGFPSQSAWITLSENEFDRRRVFIES